MAITKALFSAGAIVVFALQPAPPSQPEPLPPSAVVLDLLENGIALTSKAEGVTFDLDADGKPEQVGWTAAGPDDSFLAVDWNDNGRIDGGGELVGSRIAVPGHSPRSGFNAMPFTLQGIPVGPDGRAVIPTPLPVGFEAIDKSDGIYRRLRAWTDANHDGLSQASEWRVLEDANITRILTVG